MKWRDAPALFSDRCRVLHLAKETSTQTL